jgi:hypothetical protein
VTINTNVAVNSAASLNVGKGGLALASLFGLGFLGFAFRRRASRWGSLLLVVCALLCGGAISGITACSTKSLGGGSSSVATPAGSYWVSIIARETGSLPIQSKPYIVYSNGNLVSLPFTVNLTVTK